MSRVRWFTLKKHGHGSYKCPVQADFAVELLVFLLLRHAVSACHSSSTVPSWLEINRDARTHTRDSNFLLQISTAFLKILTNVPRYILAIPERCSQWCLAE